MPALAVDPQVFVFRDILLQLCFHTFRHTGDPVQPYTKGRLVVVLRSSPEVCLNLNDTTLLTLLCLYEQHTVLSGISSDDSRMCLAKLEHGSSSAMSEARPGAGTVHRCS